MIFLGCLIDRNLNQSEDRLECHFSKYSVYIRVCVSMRVCTCIYV